MAQFIVPQPGTEPSKQLFEWLHSLNPSAIWEGDDNGLIIQGHTYLPGDVIDTDNHLIVRNNAEVRAILDNAALSATGPMVRSLQGKEALVQTLVDAMESTSPLPTKDKS